MTNREWLRTLNVDDLESAIKIACEKGISMWLNQEHKEKLKPCANCGGRAEFFPYNSFNNSDTGCIRCIDCGMRTSTGQKFEVIEIWNRRADDGKTSNRPK